MTGRKSKWSRREKNFLMLSISKVFWESCIALDGTEHLVPDLYLTFSGLCMISFMYDQLPLISRRLQNLQFIHIINQKFKGSRKSKYKCYI